VTVGVVVDRQLRFNVGYRDVAPDTNVESVSDLREILASFSVVDRGGSAAAGACSSSDCATAITGSSSAARPTSTQRAVGHEAFKIMVHRGSVFMGIYG
jgi:hypothetical protein